MALRGTRYVMALLLVPPVGGVGGDEIATCVRRASIFPVLMLIARSRLSLID